MHPEIVTREPGSCPICGMALELRARIRTGAAIRSLLGLVPKFARRICVDGSEKDVPLDHVHVGERLRIRPGEKIPVGAGGSRPAHGPRCSTRWRCSSSPALAPWAWPRPRPCRSWWRLAKGRRWGCSSSDAEAIETLGKIDTLVVDKKGTLTEGRPRMASLSVANGFDEKEVLRVAASAEVGSEHPLARAIVEGAKERGIDLAPSHGFESSPGRGVKVRVEGRFVAVRNRRRMAEVGVDPTPLAEAAEALLCNEPACRNELRTSRQVSFEFSNGLC